MSFRPAGRPAVLGDTLLPYILSLAEAPHRPACARIGGHARLRWRRGEVLAAAHRVAAWLLDREIGPGDRVLLLAGGGPLWVAGFFGCLLRGAVAVPLDIKLTLEQIAACAGRVDPVAGLGESRQPPVADLAWLSLDELRDAGGSHPEPAAPPPRPDDLVEIIFTSGTAGRPHAVPITHRNLLASMHGIERGYRRRSFWVERVRPRLLCTVPPSHLFGQVVGVLIPLLMRLPVVFLDDLRPRVVRETLRRERIAAAIAVPRLLRLMRDDLAREGRAPADLEGAQRAVWWRRAWAARRVHAALGWRFLAWISGGAALEEETEAFWERCGFFVVQGYGLTESAPIISVSNPFARRRGSVGRPLSGQEIRVAPDGELWVRGDNVASGYLDDPAATERVFRDGWLRTGDRVERDADGALRVKGRLKDIIVTPDGVNVDPAVVERELEREAGVREAAVVAVEGARGEEVHAVLVLQGDRPVQEIVGAANARLPAGQRAQAFSVWPGAALPRTTTGKLRRARVREALGERPAVSDGAGDTARSADPVVEALTDLTGRSARSLTAGIDLENDLGLSSLDRLDLLVRLEEAAGRSLDETAVATARTLSDLQVAARRPPVPPLSMPRWARRAPVRWARSAGQLSVVRPVFHLLFRLRVEGVENLAGRPLPFLVAANHESQLDTPAILFALPPRVRRRVAVAMSTEHLPGVFGPKEDSAAGQKLAYAAAVLLFHAYPLARDAAFSVTLSYTGELIDAGFCPLIFPEGKMRHPGEAAPPFRDGLSVLARDLRVPVVPVGLEGTGRALPPRAWRPRPGVIRVRFGAPLEVRPDEEQQIGRFTSRLEHAVRELIPGPTGARTSG